MALILNLPFPDALRDGQTDAPTALHPNATAQGTPAAFTPAEGSAYQDGLRDRAAWEQWFNGLQGDYKTGAFFWSSQRSLPKPGSCKQMNADFYAGCTDAKNRLSASDTLRKTQPDYKAGWNAWTADATPPSPQPTPTPAPVAAAQAPQPPTPTPVPQNSTWGRWSGPELAESQRQYCEFADQHSKALSAATRISDGNDLIRDANDKAERQIDETLNSNLHNFFATHTNLDQWAVKIEKITASTDNTVIVQLESSCGFYSRIIAAVSRNDTNITQLLESAKTGSYALVSGMVQAVGYQPGRLPTYLTIQSPVITTDGGQKTVAASVNVNDPAILGALKLGAAAAQADYDKIHQQVEADILRRALRGIGLK
jgi:hypothetical protein